MLVFKVICIVKLKKGSWLINLMNNLFYSPILRRFIDLEASCMHVKPQRKVLLKNYVENHIFKIINQQYKIKQKFTNLSIVSIKLSCDT